MNWIAIILGISIVGISTTIVLAICKSGATADWNLYLGKCKTCKHFINKNTNQREIFCKYGWHTTDEIMNCEKKEKEK